MKKLFFIFAVALSTGVNAQLSLTGQPLYQNQSEFLKKYGIENYMSVWNRYVLNDTMLITQCNNDIKKQLQKKYKQFCLSNTNLDFQNDPDTIFKFNGMDFLIKTNLDLLADDNLIYALFSYNTKTQYTSILGYNEYSVYRDNIKRIIIVEYFNISNNNSTTLSFEIILEYIDGSVKSFVEVQNKYTGDCDYCLEF